MSASTGKKSEMKLSVKEMVLVALFAAIMAICSWIAINIGDVPITLQTFGVFICFLILGGKDGLLSVLIFIILGAVGVPVFANFRGGIQVIVGPTGGYIVGFIFSALFLWLTETIEKKTGLKVVFTRHRWLKYVYLCLSLIIALIICYAFGTAWFIRMYAVKGTTITVSKALALCVIPYVGFDIIKIALALVISIPVNRALRNYR